MLFRMNIFIIADKLQKNKYFIGFTKKHFRKKHISGMQPPFYLLRMDRIPYNRLLIDTPFAIQREQ